MGDAGGAGDAGGGAVQPGTNRGIARIRKVTLRLRTLAVYHARVPCRRQVTVQRR
jgi:hypothetical protein